MTMEKIFVKAVVVLILMICKATILIFMKICIDSEKSQYQRKYHIGNVITKLCENSI